VKKNKLAPPFTEAEFDIMNVGGISLEGDLVDLGLNYDLLTKSGAFFRYQDKVVGQGREATKLFLRENPKIATKLEKAIWERARKKS